LCDSRVKNWQELLSEKLNLDVEIKINGEGKRKAIIFFDGVMKFVYNI
jgi:hypothetical protein